MAYYMYKDTGGYWRWRYLAGNHRIIADSGEGYVNKSDCRSAIDLMKGSSGAPVYEQ